MGSFSIRGMLNSKWHLLWNFFRHLKRTLYKFVGGVKSCEGWYIFGQKCFMHVEVAWWYSGTPLLRTVWIVLVFLLPFDSWTWLQINLFFLVNVMGSDTVIHIHHILLHTLIHNKHVMLPLYPHITFSYFFHPYIQEYKCPNKDLLFLLYVSSRGGNFDSFTYERVDSGYILFMTKRKFVEQVKSAQCVFLMQ